MARILLGVCGGIAAYKALELTRLAMKAGHAVRVIQTEAAGRFVGAASFAGITGAPVLVTEWEPDPLRGAFPGDPAPAHAPLSHLELVDRADVFLVAPASANTIAKLAAGQADNLLCAAALACRRPLLVAPAMNDAMYEHPATARQPGDAARARRDRARAGHGRPRLPRRVGDRPAARAARAARGGGVGARRRGRRRPRRPGRAGHGGRHARADRRRALRRQPVLGADGLRARRGGGAPRRPRHGHRRQRRRSRAGPASATSTWRPPPSSRTRASASWPAATCCSWPPPWPTTAPPTRGPDKITKDDDGAGPHARARAHGRRAGRPGRAPARRPGDRRASPPRPGPTPSPARARSCGASAWTPSCSTTSPRRASASTRRTTR